MRPVRRRDIVPEMDKIWTCLFRRVNASEGDGTAGDRRAREGASVEVRETLGGRREVRMVPMDAITVSLCLSVD